MNEEVKKKDLGDGWLLCKSRRREGRSYLFNKSTGETKWCDGSKDVQEILEKATTSDHLTIKTEEVAKPKTPLNVAAKIKTPAQDRLKRLQRDIRLTQEKKEKEPQISKRLKVNISTPLPAGRYKSPNSELDKSNSQAIETKASTSSSSSISLTASESLRQKTTKRKATTQPELEKPTKTAVVVQQTLSLSPSKYSLSSISAAFVKPAYNKVKEMCMQAFNSLAAPQKTDNADQDLNSLRVTTELTAEKAAAFSNRKFIIPKRRLNESTPKQLPVENIPVCNTKGIANERLSRLRKSLQQLQNESQTNGTDLQEMQQDPDEATSDISQIEPMDWEQSDVPLNEDPVSGLPGKKLKIDTNATTIGDYLDVVGANIVRIAAERCSARKQKWLNDYFYFVLDTNIWLDQLAFIKDLMKMKPCSTSGVIIYVPYRVLQELDKLKQHTTREGLKTRAARAIKFLNEKFDENSVGLQAQSAIAERKHLINVTSPDDSIINCCLQVKENVEHLMLLSEDINLRNKAISNDILVTTKVELLRKKF